MRIEEKVRGMGKNGKERKKSEPINRKQQHEGRKEMTRCCCIITG